jgi:hypothetical protein
MSATLPELFSQLGTMIKATYRLVKTQKPINKEMDKLIADGKISDEMAAHYELVKNDGKQKGVKPEKGRTNIEQMQYLIDFAKDLEDNVTLFPESAHDDIATYIGCIEQVAEVGASMDADEAEKKAKKAERKAERKAAKAERKNAVAERLAAKKAEADKAAAAAEEAAEPAAEEAAEKAADEPEAEKPAE